MKGRLVAGLAVGAAVGWVVRAERERIAAALHEAAERSRSAVQVLTHGLEPIAAAPPPAPPAPPAPEAPVHAPAPERPRPEPVPLAVVEPAPVRRPEPEPAPVAVAAVPAPAASPPDQRRRRFAVASAIAAILFALVAAGAASWREWDDGPSSSSAASVPATASLISQPGATRLPFRQSSGTLSVVVGRSGRAVLVGSNVPAAPTAKDYEVWVVRAGEPKRAGLFRGGPGSVTIPLSRNVPPGATVAVTLERRGGTSAPTSTPLYHATRSLPPAVLAILAERNALHLPLTQSHGSVSVVVGAGDRAVLISSKLAAAPAGKQYQVWVIRGKSVLSAGLFDGGAGRDVIALTRRVPAGATVAVTLERQGGVAAPSQSPRFYATRA